MFSHENCAHPKTKVARAACRRAHASDTTGNGEHPAQKAVRGRGPKLPSVIAPKLRPLVDEAKARGLKIRMVTDPPEGVEQGFVIMHPKKPNCQLIAEAFRAASKGREGKAEFYHVEDNRSRQLSRARALADLESMTK